MNTIFKITKEIFDSNNKIEYLAFTPALTSKETNIDNLEIKIKYMIDEKNQLKEDVELMEFLLMHKFNKDFRVAKWASYK